MSAWTPPGIPASAGALVFDRRGRLLVLEPTYKSGWTVPGGVLEAGETPWEGCRREVAEETGLDVTSGRLACVDTRPAKKGRPLGLRFLFHCGVLPDRALRRITLQAEEIASHRLMRPEDALEALRPPVRRRVGAALAHDRCVYLENGREIDGVG
ncbi:NUDIX domain-containing protein [Agilicoccus flavus]|uniref:NUDIX domain-containing protein n=1 Tax=Agilicoccus flavus TaxID=2775968 RepID=UPI001CF6098A|nr:NUDIX hydrolase [Agilicoccus flavus]